MIARDDPILREHPDPVPNFRRASLMRWWHALNRDDDSRFVNLPWARLIQTTDVDWPAPESEDR